MPHVLSIERIAEKRSREEGLQEGRQQGLRDCLIEAMALGLELRFGESGAGLSALVEKITDLDRLRKIKRAIAEGASLDAVAGLIE
ncbi:MAG: hypothetical protein HYV63_01860 [Candidatus Schekmanbacteria bacterium]|nr:hypothetical protein [Candidatus Schekmanbacteria bacterium]